MPTDHPIAHEGVERQDRSDPNKVYVTAPTDVPAYLSYVRVMDGDRGLLGHKMLIDAFTMSAKVEIKFIRNPRMMVVYVDGEEVKRVAAE